MPTSPLYDSTYQLLQQRLPTVLTSQLENLSLLVVGVTLGSSLHQLLSLSDPESGRVCQVPTDSL